MIIFGMDLKLRSFNKLYSLFKGYSLFFSILIAYVLLSYIYIP